MWPDNVGDGFAFERGGKFDVWEARLEPSGIVRVLACTAAGGQAPYQAAWQGRFRRANLRHQYWIGRQLAGLKVLSRHAQGRQHVCMARRSETSHAARRLP